VADDLLKNDGKRFIEMMEQLAERRMRREGDVEYAAQQPTPVEHHNDRPLEDEEVYDDEGDYDSQEDYEEEEEDEMVFPCQLAELSVDILIYNRAVLLKNNVWKKEEECFKYLQLECLNNAY